MNKEKVKRGIRKIIRECEYDELYKVCFLEFVCNRIKNSCYSITDKDKIHDWREWHENEMWEKIVNLYNENNIMPYTLNGVEFYNILYDVYKWKLEKYCKKQEKLWENDNE